MIALGKRLLGAGAIALGSEGLWWGDFAPPWQPVPHSIYAYVPLAYATALALLAAGVGLQLQRTARAAGLLLAALFGLFTLFWVARIIDAPRVVAMWSGCAEDGVLLLGALLATRATSIASWQSRSARLGLGACLLAFAAAHFVYSRETASMVPSWMPPNGLTWAYVTGVAHAVAGLALLADLFSVAAAWSVTVMFAVFEVLVWLPMLATAPAVAMNWRGSAINLCLFASALLVAELLAMNGATKTPPQPVSQSRAGAGVMTSTDPPPKSRLTQLLLFYEDEHRNPANRLIHHVAHAIAVAGVITALRRPAAGIACVASALPISWVGHLLFERNRPAFFDKSSRGGIDGGGVAKKAAVAVGGIIWSAACAMRLIHAGPLAVPLPAPVQPAADSRTINAIAKEVQTHD